MQELSAYRMQMPPEHRLSVVLPLLSLFREYGHEAYIGGGALRDAMHGVPMKDVDIFVMPYRDGPVLGPRVDSETIEEILGGFAHKHQVFNYAFSDVAEQWIFEGEGDGPPLNFIAMRHHSTPEQLARRMDFGICQIVLTAEDECWVTPQWAVDYLQKTFTLTDPDREERALRRWERISERYPEHTLVIPQEASQ